MLFKNNSLSLKNILPSIIYNFFAVGDKRTLSLKKNVLGAFLLRGLDSLLGFIRVPLIISFLSVSEYGIWITLSSIIGWFSLFDIGLSNGLKTKLSEALAKKDYPLAKVYISTTYATITIIISIVFFLFLILFPFLNWAKILNVPAELSSGISIFVFIFVLLFSLQFIVNIISTILTSDQKPSLASSIGAVSGIVYLLILFLVSRFTRGSLIHLALFCNGTSVVIYLTASIILFKMKYKEVAPDFKSVDFTHFRELASLGIKFFFIQISSIILFSTDTIIITQLYSPAEVAPYSVSMKYMGIPLMLFSLLTWPLWAAYADAYAIKDLNWIKKTVSKLVSIWVFMIVIVFACFLFSNKFYDIWLRGTIEVPLFLSAMMGVYSILIAWNQIYVYFLNGVGKIKLQLYMGFVTIILNIPLSIIFARNFNMGTSGVILASNVCILIGSIWAPIQYNKIIKGTARGIWDA